MDDILAPLILSTLSAAAILATLGGLLWAAVMDGRDERAWRRDHPRSR